MAGVGTGMFAPMPGARKVSVIVVSYQIVVTIIQPVKRPRPVDPIDVTRSKRVLLQ